MKKKISNVKSNYEVGSGNNPTSHLKNPASHFPRLTSKHGFTLIELLITITIIAILIAVGTLSWTMSQKKGRDGKRKSDAKTLQQALEEYHQVNKQYPPDSACSDESGWTTSGSGTIYQDLVAGSVQYLNSLPKDPANNASFKYCFISTLNPNTSKYSTYKLYLALENSSDVDAVANPSDHGAGYEYANYMLKSP